MHQQVEAADEGREVGAEARQDDRAVETGGPDRAAQPRLERALSEEQQAGAPGRPALTSRQTSISNSWPLRGMSWAMQPTNWQRGSSANSRAMRSRDHAGSSSCASTALRMSARRAGATPARSSCWRMALEIAMTRS